MKSSKKIGAVLSYTASALNFLISIFLTPFILNSLGDAEYGVYRTVQSLTSQLALITIGIGTISAVYVARFNARKDADVEKDRENFFATGITISALIGLIVLCVGFILYGFVDNLYANTMTVEQIELVQQLYVILVINVALYLFRDVFVGIVNGYERFAFGNGLKVLRLLLRIVLVIVLLNMGFGALALVWCDLALTIVLLLLDAVYCFWVLKIRVRFHGLDKTLFRSVFTFSFAMFLQTIVNQVNQNLDGVILGATISMERVAVYSLALTIYVAFNGLVSSINTLFTPEAARLIQQDAASDRLMAFVIRVGRIQGFATFLIVGGFIAVGQEFVSVWAGADKMDVYYLSLLLLLPTSFAVTLSGANSILDGMMKRLGRSIVLVVAAVINLTVSLLLIPHLDYWGAAIGTAVSVIIGQLVAMCIHYHHVFGFRAGRFFAGLLKGILPCTLLAVVATIPLNFLHFSVWWMLLIKGFVYVAVYGGSLWLFGMNQDEKRMLLHKVQK